MAMNRSILYYNAIANSQGNDNEDDAGTQSFNDFADIFCIVLIF